jgi:hypothetical protein
MCRAIQLSLGGALILELYWSAEDADLGVSLLGHEAYGAGTLFGLVVVKGEGPLDMLHVVIGILEKVV